jgi:hypothetical protein
MSLPVNLDIADPDPSDAPTTFGDMIQLLRTLITAEVTGDYLPYVTGSATPDVGDQDKVWHRTDGGGRPMGTYVYYSGSWRRQYVGNQNMILMYRGDPSIDFTGAGGLGAVGGEWDGWALCNGNNGTVDLSDKFIVASHMSDMTIGYAGGQHSTNVTGSTTQTGGVAEVTLTNDDTYRPARPAVSVGRQTADGNAASVSGPLYGVGTAGSVELLAADAGNETPDAISTVPPYLALAFAQFVGYA